ncbi:DUF89 domain-containing protein [Haematococcus lacustris]|uniref:DUF89 domain-containing protein n=1 Tax=Haematococcus lacustris TaxID=44745 RepID=A0A699YSQ9_HAELA|nr:DUF89 domain-containing protein [Haematococcus lacustris]
MEALVWDEGAVIVCHAGSNANEEASKPTYKDWIQVFRHSLPIFKEHALKDEQVATSGAREAMALAFEQRFLAALNVLEHQPYLKLEGFQAQPLSCLSLCSIREVCLRQAGFHDIFAAVKSRENQAALAVLPSLLQELDGILDAKARWEQLLRGVFAGNIFDLGAAASAALYAEGSASAPAFAATRAALLTRPWAEDDLEAAVEHLARQPGYRSAVVFVDNAGSDVVLGMLPLARELVRQGCQCDLVILEGMGRAIETNLYAKFK